MTVGDTMDVTLSTGETVTFQVAGVNTYGLGEVDYIAKDCLKDQRNINNTDTNVGGFASSKMRTWLNDTFYTELPNELQTAITEKPIRTTSGGAYDDADKHEIANCKVWLPTAVEVLGNECSECGSTEKNTSKQYQLFVSDKSSRLKKLGANGSATNWYTASPDDSNNDRFIMIMYNTGDETVGYTANVATGVAPGFRIIPN